MYFKIFFLHLRLFNFFMIAMVCGGFFSQRSYSTQISAFYIPESIVGEIFLFSSCFKDWEKFFSPQDAKNLSLVSHAWHHQLNSNRKKLTLTAKSLKKIVSERSLVSLSLCVVLFRGHREDPSNAVRIMVSLRSLEPLDVRGCDAFPWDDGGFMAEDASNFIKVLKTFPHLKDVCLDFSNNQMGFMGTALLAKALDVAPLQKLTHFSLNLFKNAINNYGVIAIAKVLHKLSNVVHLNLNFNDNNIDCCGITSLVMGFELMPHLRTLMLGLNHNFICKDGACTLALGLNKLIKLTSLKLSVNAGFINIEGVSALLKTFERLISLTSLHFEVSYNDIKDAELVVLLAGFKNLPCLVNLSFIPLGSDQSRVSDEGPGL